MKKTKVTEEQIVVAVDAEINQWEDEENTTLSGQRANAMEYYLGQPFGNERKDGSSTVVTREVMDTIEWIKPELLKKFAGGEQVVRFDPKGPDDIKMAELETAYINHLVMEKNEGFSLLYSWITDALLQKNGTVKAWWNSDKEITRENYTGLTETELQMLLSDEGVTLLEQEARVVNMMTPNGPMQEEVHDVVVAVEGAEKGLQIVNVPPEEYVFSVRGTNETDTPFQAHRRLMSISDIRAMGYEVPDDGEGLDHDAQDQWEDEKRARHDYDDTNPEDYDYVYSDETTREVWVDEAYIRMDKNGDGIAELLKVFKSGSVVFECVEVPHAPFASWTPIILPHKFHGLSMADLVMDLQRLQSQLFRNMLDNQYQTNNGRYAVLENMVNLEDAANGGPQGMVRIKTPGAYTRIDTPQLSQTAFKMFDLVERLREKRTGTSERTQGLDPNSLGPNTAAHAVNQVMTAAQQRIELIARVFGETGLKKLFKLVHAEVSMHAEKSEMFLYNDDYVEVNPREWATRKRLSVVVGLGNGSRDNELQQLQMVFQNQMMLSQNPKTEVMVSPQNIYMAMDDMVKLSNRSAQGRYFSDPTSQESQKRQQKAQENKKKQKEMGFKMAQQELQIKKMEGEAKMLSAKSDAQRKEAQTQIDEAKLAMADEHHEDDIALQTAEMQLEAALEAEQGRGVEIG